MNGARRSIYIEGFGHGSNPVPAACAAGGWLVSGALFGMDPETRKLCEGPLAQCDRMFAVAESVLEAAGSSWKQVLKMTFYLAPDCPREIINAQWVRVFPEPDSRPARHVIINDRLPPGMHLQCDLMALTNSPQ